MSPERIFQILLGVGALSGAWLYGEYRQSLASSAGDSSREAELQTQNTELTVELDELRDEIAQLRSLLKNGPYPIPDDLISFVETDNGLIFTEAPHAQIASPNKLRNTAERNIEFAYGKDGIEKEEFIFERIGLIPPHARLRVQWIAAEMTEAKGLFDLTSGKILLSENFDPMSIPDSGMLVHLLTRQILFQNFPVQGFSDSEEWRAWQGIHRGAAAAAQARYLKRRSASEEVDWEDAAEERETLLNSLSPAFQGFANFPYLEGHDYAKLAYLKSRDAYREIFKSPVRSTLPLLYPNAEEAALIKSAVPHDGQIGALGLRLLLDPHLGNETSSELILQYSNDYYHEPDEALVWVIEMKTTEAATHLKKALLKIIPSENHKITQEGTGIRVTIQP